MCWANVRWVLRHRYIQSPVVEEKKMHNFYTGELWLVTGEKKYCMHCYHYTLLRKRVMPSKTRLTAILNKKAKPSLSWDLNLAYPNRMPSLYHLRHHHAPLWWCGIFCNKNGHSLWQLIVSKCSVLMHAWPVVVRDRQDRLNLKCSLIRISLFHSMGNRIWLYGEVPWA